MSKSSPVLIYIGTYANESRAQDDYDVFHDVQAKASNGSYDAALITRDAEGKIHVDKDETATRRGGWGGAAAGALVGLLFPPAIVVTAALGATAGAVGGHLWKGLSRHDIKELGELIDDDEAALVVVGTVAMRPSLDEAMLKPRKHITKELDLSSDKIEGAIRDAAGEIG